jgi:hypothetical protein
MELVVMNRVLAVILSLGVVAVLASTPEVACAGSPTLGGQHGCCGGEAVITSAPVGSCCFLSRPTSDRALTQSRNLTAKERLAEIGSSHPPTWYAIGDATAYRRARSTSPPGSSAVPIYIQQLSLLI